MTPDRNDSLAEKKSRDLTKEDKRMIKQRKISQRRRKTQVRRKHRRRDGQ